MTNGKAQDLFRAKAPGIMALFLRDFPSFVLDDAGAVLGNVGHECNGFTAMQEIKPTVVGSRGGWGWPMWTGIRRTQFEAYCRRNSLDLAGDRANYGFMLVELRGNERKAIPAVTAAKTLAEKVKAFELSYERAGAKHYDSRNTWAAIALEAFADAGGTAANRGAHLIPEWALPAAQPAAGEPAAPPPVEVPAEPVNPTPAPAPGPPVQPEGGIMNSNLFHNLLTGAMVASAAVTAGLLATGCTADISGAIECSQSIVDTRWTSGIVVGLGLVKTGINLWRDGIAGLYKPQPKIK